MEHRSLYQEPIGEYPPLPGIFRVIDNQNFSIGDITYRWIEAEERWAALDENGDPTPTEIIRDWDVTNER